MTSYNAFFHKNIKFICYLYGIYIWVIPFFLMNFTVKPIHYLLISFVSTSFFIYIMLAFKQALNIYLHSVKMNKIIGWLVYLSLLGYALNVLSLSNPQRVAPYQGLLGIGIIALYIIYAFSLKSLDAPLELLSKIKYLKIYVNCILISLIMAFTIVGVVFFVALMGVSYFILGNLLVELENLDLNNE